MKQTMFENVFTNYLIKQGWVQIDPMSFKKSNTDFEIFFDTSSQIEIYRNNKRIKSDYLYDLNHLIKELKDLDQ